MNCREALAYLRQNLEKCGIENASLEGEILLRHITLTDRASLFASPDKELDAGEFQQIGLLLKRRLAGEPSAYITGHKEFYGLDFRVDPRVLIPRPETELLVEKTIEYIQKYTYHSMTDVGTGSGCVAISIGKTVQGVRIYAVDCSESALEAAQQNVEAHGLETSIKLLKGNLLEPLKKPVNIIVANLPYVRTAETNLPYEPNLALDGGPDGLDKIKELIEQVPGKLKKKGSLLLEVGLGQAKAVVSNLHKVFPEAEIIVFKDLGGIERVVAMRLTA